ncbi:MAG TPA: helix-turn-helix domain-containing protein [Solirubrobacteraceae bacterium]|jgi:DNA-binding HxlR family transcriptional regulator|nr:helix-turn-helix domain-containing protein [Solirubrobacteraceae bacterium]
MEHDPPRCDAALSKAFDVLGKRWTGVVIGTLIKGPAGFAEVARALGGISQSVLSDRLAELTRVGLVQRTVHEGPPVAVRYALTQTGEALVPALDALAGWAAEHLRDAPAGSAVEPGAPVG